MNIEERLARLKPAKTPAEKIAKAARQRILLAAKDAQDERARFPRSPATCPVCKTRTPENLKPGNTRVIRQCTHCGYKFMMEASDDCRSYTTHKADCINGKTSHGANMLVKHDKDGFYKRCQACKFETTDRDVVHTK